WPLHGSGAGEASPSAGAPTEPPGTAAARGRAARAGSGRPCRWRADWPACAAGPRRAPGRGPAGDASASPAREWPGAAAGPGHRWRPAWLRWRRPATSPVGRTLTIRAAEPTSNRMPRRCPRSPRRRRGRAPLANWYRGRYRETYGPLPGTEDEAAVKPLAVAR